MDGLIHNRRSPALFSTAIANGLLFNVTWLAIVLTQSALLAPLIAAVHVLLHFHLMGRGRAECWLLMTVTVLGLTLDQILFALGVFTLAGQVGLPPLWLSCLWPVLATTLMHAFASLATRPLLAAILGAVGGAGSYIAGTNLSGVDFGDATVDPWIIAFVWALLFPALLRLSTLFAKEED